MIKYIIELQSRFILLMLCWINTFVIVYLYKEILLFEILKTNIKKTDVNFNYFIFTNVTELFATYIKLGYFISNQILHMYILYNFLYFMAPGLYNREYNLLKFIFQLIFLFWVLSLTFLNIFFAPVMWEFFLSFQNTLTKQLFNVHFEAKIAEYLDFFIKTCHGCNLQFQLLVCLVLFLSYFSVNKNSIRKNRKSFYFLFLLIATMLSPPDLISQSLICLSLILFFEFIVLVCLLLNECQN